MLDDGEVLHEAAKPKTPAKIKRASLIAQIRQMIKIFSF